MSQRKIFLILLTIFYFSFDVLFASLKEVVLTHFENGIPCSECGDIIGFRKLDVRRASIVNGGAERSAKSAVFKFIPDGNKTPEMRDLFFQGKLRRMYLETKRAEYDENGPNALSFWIKLKNNSVFINEEKNTLGVWTYHWELGDEYVGGKSNQGLATDSMMHGYSNFSFTEKAAGKWVRVILTPSAFQQSRYYYHFYAGRGTTDNLKFFPSVRQLQFHIFPEIINETEIQLDQLKLIHLPPTAIFNEEFFKAKVSKDIGDFNVPVIIQNPTDKERIYRVFISSFLGAHRNVLYGAHTLTDNFSPPRMLQSEVGGDGGTGIVEMIDDMGDSVIEKKKEIFISARGMWRGKLVHHIKPEMLGPIKQVKYANYVFFAKRDTLTTSVIVWDAYDKTLAEIDYIKALPSNADDGNHVSPPGFPKQKRPPEGWRSEDIPINQVGGYFVSVIQITD
jgi:hypothetical protein